MLFWSNEILPQKDHIWQKDHPKKIYYNLRPERSDKESFWEVDEDTLVPPKLTPTKKT